jgi:F-type H+-transporting ATPase subunit delta
VPAHAVARRYARALYDAVTPAERPKVAAELKALGAAFVESDDLRHLLVNPAFSADERRRAIEAIHPRARTSPSARRLIDRLIEQRRAREIKAVADAFGQLADDEAGVLRATFVSAHPLTDAARGQIRVRLAQVTGRTIEDDVRVEPDLLGGVLVRLGSVVFDGTVRGKLQRMKQSLRRFA